MAEHKDLAQGVTGYGTLFRTFDTGATRDVDTDKFDYEGFLSPLVLEAYAKYMHKNRYQKDGNIRDSDNWQKGIPQDSYMKSMWRHFLHLWTRHRGFKPTDPMASASMEEDLCAMLFNAQGMLHELLKAKQ